jgi:hypothetical protein
VSAVQLVQSLQLVLQAAVPDANVVIGIPKQFHDSILVYLWRDGPPRDVLKTTDTIRRHHDIHIHLLVQSTGDDQNAELLYLDLADRISDCFQTNRRLLTQGVNSTIAVKPLGSQYVLIDGGEYRCAAWIWTAEEQLSFQFA